jgi:hypothetical protein
MLDETTATRELIRYAVSRKMFCRCGIVLDCRSAYLISYAIPEERGTVIVCPACAKGAILPALSEQPQLDGTVSTWGRGEVPLIVRKPAPGDPISAFAVQQTLNIGGDSE